MVTVNRVYHPEVFELLEQFGAKSIEAHKFYMLELTGKGNFNAEIHISGDCYKGILTEDELSCRNKLLDLYGKNSQAFGESKFYQSFPKIKLE